MNNSTSHFNFKLIITMLFSTGGRQQQIEDRKMQANCCQFRLPCGFGGKTRGASPDGAHQGLHWKPLDAAIGQVPALYYPGGRHGRQIC